jgi:hypothetical protein
MSEIRELIETLVAFRERFLTFYHSNNSENLTILKS